MSVLVKYDDESPEKNWNCAKSTIIFNDEVISNKLVNVLNVNSKRHFFSARSKVGRDRLRHLLTFILAENMECLLTLQKWFLHGGNWEEMR